MKLKSLLLSILIITISNICFSQDSLKNAVFFELGGNGLYYSLNYERQFKHQFLGRAGITVINNGLAIPLTVGKFFGEDKHHVEVSAGFDYINYDMVGDSRGHTILATGFVGYRFQKLKNQFLFRAGLLPLFRIYESGDGEKSEDRFFLWGGISLGYRF